MELKILCLLPETVKRVVCQIEEAVGSNILVEENLNNPIYGCNPRDGGWVILVPDLENIRSGSLMHEVLHIERIVLQNSPRMRSESDENFDLIRYLDNQVEHLSIFPVEFSIDFNRKSFWGMQLHRFLDDLKNNYSDKRILRIYLFITWLIINKNYSSRKLKRKAKNLLKINALFLSAQKFIKTAENKVGVKPDIFVFLAEEFEIPIEDIEILENDMRTNLKVWRDYYAKQ